MKKFLSLLLALTLALSCFSVVGFAEDVDDPKYEQRPDCVAQVIDPIVKDLNTAFSTSLNQVGYDSVDELANAGKSITDFDAFLKSANSSDSMFGMPLSDLYTDGTTIYAWPNFRVRMVGTDDHTGSSCSFKKTYDECAAVLNGNIYEYEGKAQDKTLFEYINEVEITIGKNVGHYNYYFVLSKSELSLARANINLYLKRVVSNYWGGGKFYTNENLVTITNFIGTLLNPSFILLEKGSKPIADNVKMDAYTFFGKIVELSGLGAIIDANWCKQSSIDFLPLMDALGVQTEYLLTGEKEEGYYVGRRLLTDMFSEFCSAPLSYVLNILWKFSKEYSVSYVEAFKALFTMRRSQRGDTSLDYSNYSEESLGTVTGAFNFLSDSIDSVLHKMYGSTLGDNLEFAQLPVRRLAMSQDHDEVFLMTICYLDINRIYKDNKSALQRLWNVFEKNTKSTLTNEELTTIKSFYSEYVQGNLTMKSFLYDMLDDVTMSNADLIGTDIKNSLKTSIANLLKKIVDALDNFVRILLGERNPFDKLF